MNQSGVSNELTKLDALILQSTTQSSLAKAHQRTDLRSRPAMVRPLGYERANARRIALGLSQWEAEAARSHPGKQLGYTMLDDSVRQVVLVAEGRDSRLESVGQTLAHASEKARGRDGIAALYGTERGNELAVDGQPPRFIISVLRGGILEIEDMALRNGDRFARINNETMTRALNDLAAPMDDDDHRKRGGDRGKPQARGLGDVAGRADTSPCRDHLPSFVIHERHCPS